MGCYLGAMGSFSLEDNKWTVVLAEHQNHQQRVGGFFWVFWYIIWCMETIKTNYSEEQNFSLKE